MTIAGKTLQNTTTIDTFHNKDLVGRGIGQDVENGAIGKVCIERDQGISLKDFQQQVAAGMAAEDRSLVYKMVGVGVGLVVILSLYLLIMTHKVAGPLYKISSYFDRMSEGRLGSVSALRRGDMLQDFFGNFREMHEAVRTRMQSDVITMESAAVALRAKAGDSKQLADALDTLDKHLVQRKKQLL